MKTDIVQVLGRRIWDSRGRPTVEAEVHLSGGATGRAAAPAGASTGSGEAVDRRDGGPRFGGLDVREAVASINTEIRDALRDRDCTDQENIDAALIDLDGTTDKSRLGGNALIAVSMAAAHAAAAAHEQPLWQYLAGDRAEYRLPLPEIQIFGGGVHAGRRVDIQDFMIIPVGAGGYEQALEWSAEVYRAAGEIMHSDGLRMGVADEGGWWPAFESNEAALTYLVRAIERAGFQPGTDIGISLDIAASSFGRRGRYRLARDDRELDGDGMSALLLGWLERYPIVAIEDPLAEDELDATARFSSKVPPGVEVVADDLICTNAPRIERAAAAGACNTALIKPNQAGTLSEAKAALEAARNAGWNAIVSARSGETEDVTLMHLAVGWDVPQVKVGSFSRTERTAKWNEGLRIAERLGDRGTFTSWASIAPRGRRGWNLRDGGPQD